MASNCSVKKTGLVAVFLSDSNDFCDEQLVSLKENIRDIIDYNQTFKDAETCERFIRSVKYERIFLIATPKLVEHIFEQNIHDIRHVEAIFVFDPHATIICIDALKCSSYKVEDVFKLSGDLIQCLWIAVKECANRSDILLSPLASCSTDETTNVINNFADLSEFWYPFYIDLLMSDSVITEDKTRFIEACRLHFARNVGTLKQLDDFEKNYQSNSALYYYSRDGFLYRFVNRALRGQNIQSILDLRFFLRKIRTELQSAYSLFEFKYDVEEWMTFFRGQRMSKDELEKLKKKYRDGTLITTNSYLSTSISREIALAFAGRPATDAVPVLFEINAQFKDPKISRLKPFAYIGGYSHYGFEELEVLFSTGSFFKIDQIYDDSSTQICTVKMTFIDDDEEKFTIVNDFRALRQCSSEIKLIKTGNLLSYCLPHGLSQAASFYETIISRNFSPMFTAACYAGLGWLALKEKNEDLSIERQHKALVFYEKLNNDGDNTAFLYMTSYNCIGLALRMKKKYDEALVYFIKADDLPVSKVPIDKYAMYDSYRNVPSVNIASLYKLMNQIDRAWEKYKKILACQMNSSNRFHGHTFLTIAQAGLNETCITHGKREYLQYSKSWKAFLDHSLTDMSSSYRRSIVSGVLLIGFEFETNEQTRTMAIDYFQKIINISRKYVHVSRDDYYIVLRCYFELARLYRETKHNYEESIKQSMHALGLCRHKDLESIFESFKCLGETFEQYFQQAIDLTPDDICTKLCEPFFPRLETDHVVRNSPQVSILVFDGSEFAFGRYKTALDPNLMLEHDHKRQFAYCCLKMAAIAQDQGDQEATRMKIKLEEQLSDESNHHQKVSQAHFQTAHQLLVKAGSLIQNSSIQTICANNLAYLNGDFDSIISTYQGKLTHQQLPCVSENMFCYIGHLYGRKKNVTEEERWYILATEHFKQHKHICEHTVPCFTTLSEFYATRQNFSSVVRTYDSLIHHLNTYRPPSFLRTSLLPITKSLIQHFIDCTDWKSVTVLFDHLVQIALQEQDDHVGADREFQNILEYCKKIDEAVLIETYSRYLEIMLRYRAVLHHAHLCAVEPAFRHAILIYRMHKDTRRVIFAYQTFLQLVVACTTDFTTLLAALQRLALDLEASHLVNDALDMYMRLAQFILTHSMEKDTLKTGFTIVRYRLLGKYGAAFNTEYQQTMVQLMGYYRNIAEPQFVIDDYLKTMKSYLNHDGSATSIYLNMLEFFIKYQSEQYTQHFRTAVNALQERPAELIAFVSTTRIQYGPLIEALFQHLTQLESVHQMPCFSVDLPSRTGFEREATLWLECKDQTDNTLAYGKCLQCILELHSIDDEYIAASYMKMGNRASATAVFSKFIYGEPALKYNPNACRRYLKYVYNAALTTQERAETEHRYAQHFVLEGDIVSGDYSFELLPLEDFDIN